MVNTHQYPCHNDQSRVTMVSLHQYPCHTDEYASVPVSQWSMLLSTLIRNITECKVDNNYPVYNLSFIDVFQVAHPSTNDVYVFNRHGHHIETRDLLTGQVLYSFTYSKNTSVGRLSQVTDSSGNKVVFFRDYRSAVSHVRR